MLLLDAATALVFSVSAVWCGYALACRSLPRESWSTRITGAAVILVWLLTVVFLLLSVPRLFTRPIGVLFWCACAGVATLGNTRIRRQGYEDVAAVREWWLALDTRLKVIASAGVVLLAMRLGHGLLAPPLTWDAMTYHLYKPAVWIQAQGLASTTGPDAAAYYQWFPPYGDVIWAWWLLAARGDAIIAVAAAGTWLMVLVACYAAARDVGAPVPRATLAAFALGFTPAVLDFVAAAHVDNLVLALFCAGALFLGRALEHQRASDAVLAAAAFGILAGVKSSAMPVCAVGVIGALATMRRNLPAALCVLAAATPAAVPPLLAWRATGSPIYPLTLRLGGRVVLAGNAELDWLLRGEWINPGLAATSRAKFLERMFLPWVRLDGDFMNLGLGVALVIVAAAGGLWTLRSVREKRLIVVFYLVAALLTVAAVAGKDGVALRLWWWPVLGRLITIAVGAAAVLAALWPHRLAAGLLAVSAAVSLASSWPGGLTVLDLQAGAIVLTAFLLIGVGCRFGSRVIPRPLVLASVGALLGLMALMVVRDRYRASYYAAAAFRQAYDVHPLDARWARNWPLWQRFDRPHPTTIAVSAGWDGFGHNWWLFPLTGRHQQNRLLYVPISLDGETFDYRLGAARFPPVSCEAWVSRLLASPAEYLVLLPPLPPEAAWAAALPHVFQLDVDLGRGRGRSYSILRDRSSASRPCAP